MARYTSCTRRTIRCIALITRSIKPAMSYLIFGAVFHQLMQAGLVIHHDQQSLTMEMMLEPSTTETTVDAGSAVEKEERGYREYSPSSTEQYIIDHAEELGYSASNRENAPKGCLIFKDPSVSTPEIHKALAEYSAEVVKHTKIIADFEPIPDLLKSIIETGSHDVCATARPHPDGLKALFPSNQLSLTDSGFVEPLAPPLRTMDLCKYSSPNPDPESTAKIMNLDYLVHDFEAMCHKLKPTSKRVLIDMGASLSFHGASTTPIVELMELYEKFGFNFDHIYAFEVTYTDPKNVYTDLLPEKYMPAYHWINVGEC